MELSAVLSIKTSFLSLAGALAVSAALSLGATQAQAEPLKIATEGAFPPFNTIDTDGKPQGFDVDIANALCAEMKTECEIVVQDWDGIIPGLLAGKYDAISASMSITPERLEAVDFTDPYYSNKLQFVAQKGKDFTVTAEGLKSKVVGVQRSTISASWMEEHMPDVEVRLYGTQEEAFLDLESGRLDIVLNDAFVTYDWLQSEAGKGFEFKGEPVYDDDKIGIAIAKGNDTLREKMNKALAAIRANGTYEKINAKYFPFSIY
jgi:polar amino acid transport system substrate-binding protein